MYLSLAVVAFDRIRLINTTVFACSALSSLMMYLPPKVGHLMHAYM